MDGKIPVELPMVCCDLFDRNRANHNDGALLNVRKYNGATIMMTLRFFNRMATAGLAFCFLSVMVSARIPELLEIGPEENVGAVPIGSSRF